MAHRDLQTSSQQRHYRQCYPTLFWADIQGVALWWIVRLNNVEFTLIFSVVLDRRSGGASRRAPIWYPTIWKRDSPELNGVAPLPLFYLRQQEHQALCRV